MSGGSLRQCSRSPKRSEKNSCGNLSGRGLGIELIVEEFLFLIIKCCFYFGWQPLLQWLGLFEECGGESQEKFEVFL